MKNMSKPPKTQKAASSAPSAAAAPPPAPSGAALVAAPAAAPAKMRRSQALGVLGLRIGTTPTEAAVDRAFRKLSLKRKRPADISLLQQARAILTKEQS